MTARIVLNGVSKLYRKYDDTARLARLGQLFTRTERSWFPALSDIDLRIEPGECVGVIGRNGAGKSTLLQLLSGITAPTSGTVEVRGRLAPLISVGVGFHPEMTGRENIYVNGTILGLGKAEIDRRFDDIVGFAELEQFIDTPVKFYSSGMFVRLGFAVAVEARPDVLLVDEVLAVGDFAFQLRCFDRMNEIKADGTTVVVVAHNMGAIRGFCDRGVVLHGGRLVHDGATFDAISCYYDLAGSSAAADAAPGDRLDVLDFRMAGPDGAPIHHARSGDEVFFRFRVRARSDVGEPFLWFGLESGSGQVIYSDARIWDPSPPLVAGEEATYEIAVPVSLPTGSYSARVAICHRLSMGTSEQLGSGKPVSFYVSGRDHVHGAVDLKAAITQLP